MHERAYVSEERLVLTAFAAYGGGFLASKLLLAPLDRWQLEQQLTGRPPLVALRQLLNDSEGVRGLWRGCAVRVMGGVSGTMLRVSAHHHLQTRWFPASDSEAPLLERAACHTSAAAVALTLTYPLDVAYTAVAGGKTSRAREYFRTVPWSALFRGYAVGLAALPPFVLLALVSHDALAARLLAPPAP